MKKRGNDLGKRMKENYENPLKLKLPMRLPVIIRIDGKAFHSFTKGFVKPFDEIFINRMAELAKFLCKEIQTCVFAYGQSDEISFLLHNFKRLTTQAFFDNEVEKIVSVTAGMASAFFTLLYGRLAVFDSRVGVYPESEVANYFVWRQQDATRNSIQMQAQSMFSHKELQGKSTGELQEIMFQKGVNWNDLPVYKKRGFAVRKVESEWGIDWEIPIFTQERNYIEFLLQTEE